MAFSTENTFFATGLRSLRYFTVLSNLLEGFGCAVFIAFSLFSKNKDVPRAISVLKFVGCASVTVTFLTVALFLAPVWGAKEMFSSFNLFLHLSIPLLSIAEFVIFEKARPTVKECFFAALPVFIYGVGYLINVLVNGIGVFPDSNDWYGFLTWGWGIGAALFAVVCAAAFAVGLLLRLTVKKK
jgi:hypothetical protein